MNAITLFTAEVFGVILRVLECEGKRWLCAEDAAKILEYRSSDSVLKGYQRHKKSLAVHSVTAKIDGTGKAARLFDKEALLYLCEHSKKKGSWHLNRWLHLGGLQHNSDDVIPFDEGRTSGTKCVDIDTFEQPEAVHKNVVDLKGEPVKAVGNAATKVNYLPLDKQSQASIQPVLFFDANANSGDLKDNAMYRFDAAHELLHSVACFYGNSDDPKAISAVASAASLLLSDTQRMLSVLFNRLEDYESALIQLKK